MMTKRGILVALLALLLLCTAVVGYLSFGDKKKDTKPTPPTTNGTKDKPSGTGDTSTTNVTRTKWYAFDQKGDHSLGNTFNDWTDPSNWGFESAEKCIKRCNETTGCVQVGYSPWQDNNGALSKGYCYMRKKPVWPLEPWANKEGIVPAQSQRSYVKADEVPQEHKTLGTLVEF